MSTLEELNERYREVKRKIREQNEARKNDSDDYDPMEWDRLNNEERSLRMQILEAGGNPDAVTATGGTGTPAGTPAGGATPTPTPGPGAGTPAPAPTGPGDGLPDYPEGDPRREIVERLRRARERAAELRARTPRRPVRLDVEGGKVDGGSEAELREQTEWRAELDQAEHDQAVAEGELAFENGGGPGAFTDEEKADLRRRAEEIEADQAELARVNEEIARYDQLIEEASGLLRGNQAEGGGPSAGGAGAIAAGARYQGELRRLYAEQAEIMRRITERQRALAQRVLDKVRRLIRDGARDLGIDLHPPAAPTNRTRAEEELLRRIYRRLGLPDIGGHGASGLLGGRRRPGFSLVPPSRPVLAVTALVMVVLLVAVVALVSSGDDPTTVAIEPAAETAADDDTEPAGDDANTPEDDGGVPAVAAPGPATRATVGMACPIVTHRPPPGHPQSLSYFTLAFLVAPLDGLIGDGAEVTVEVAGADAPATAPVDGRGVAAVDVPISSYGSYTVRSATLRVGRGPEIDITDPVQTATGTVTVTGAEGAAGGCHDPRTASDDALDAARAELGAYQPPPQATSADAGHDSDTAAPPPDEATSTDPLAPFRAFLAEWIDAHRRGDAGFLAATLDTATIDRYGADRCRAYLEEVVGSVTAIEVVDGRAEPYDYDLDGRSTTIAGSWTLAVDITVAGDSQPQRTTMHLHPTDDGVRWFTDCGDPL